MSNNEPPPQQPPPPGGYGGPPPPPSGYSGPPPPPGGYGGPPPVGGGAYSVGTAWRYGWDKFVANLGQVLIAVLVLVAVNIVINILGGIVSDAIDAIYLQWIFSLASWVVSMIIAAGIVRFALDVTEGKELNAATVLTPHKLGEVIIASLLISIATFVGLLLCILPGLAVMFFTSFTLYFLMDRPELGAIDAIKASFDFTTKNAGNVIVWFLLSLATWLVGALLCGIGLIAAVPIVLIGTAYTYKSLRGEPVAA